MTIKRTETNKEKKHIPKHKNSAWRERIFTSNPEVSVCLLSKQILTDS